MTKEIPQELARRMAELLAGDQAAEKKLQPFSQAYADAWIASRDAILAALPKDDPVADAVAFFDNWLLPNVNNVRDEHWATIKAALAERRDEIERLSAALVNRPDEAAIRADERQKAEGEIADMMTSDDGQYPSAGAAADAFFHHTGLSGTADFIRSGAYRKEKA